MSKASKWNTERENTKELTKDLHAVFFTSRNKDNQDLEGFKARKKTFLTTKTVDELQKDFVEFVSKGVKGEMSRFYYSLNSRSQEKTQKALLHLLIDEKINMAAIPQVAISVAMKKEQQETKKWMFDYDDTEEKLEMFLADLQKDISDTPGLTDCEVTIHKTPNGYAIITSKGFKTDQVLKWKEVELKKDDFVCVDWSMKNI